MLRDIIEDGLDYLITALLFTLFVLLFVSPIILAIIFSPWWFLLVLLYPFIIAAAKNIYN